MKPDLALVILFLATACAPTESRPRPENPTDEGIARELASKLEPGIGIARLFALVDSLSSTENGQGTYDLLVICQEYDISVRPKDERRYMVVTRRFPSGGRPAFERTERSRDEVELFLVGPWDRCEAVSIGIGSRWGLEIELDSVGRIESHSPPSRK